MSLPPCGSVSTCQTQISRACDRRQKFRFLLVGAPADQHRRDDARQSVEHMGQVEPVFEELGVEHHLVIDREIGAAVFFRIERKEPALGAQFFRQPAAKFVFVLRPRASTTTPTSASARGL